MILVVSSMLFLNANPHSAFHSPYVFLYVSNILIVFHYCRYKNQAAVQTHVKAPYFREFAAKLPSLSAKPWELRAGGFLGGLKGVSRL